MTMHLLPADLPRLRDDLVAFAGTPFAHRLREMDIMQNRTPRELATVSDRRAVEALTSAELFYITAEMGELVEAAAKSLPDFLMTDEDPPSRTGLAWFCHPIEDVDDNDDRVFAVAVSWVTIGHTVRISTWVDRDSCPDNVAEVVRKFRLPQVFCMGSWQPFMDDDGRPKRHELGVNAGDNFLTAVKTLWLLMRQPLTQETTERPDRATRRRLEREGRTPPPIRVINLRRPPGSGGSGESGREFHVRWIVRGHWRQAACGVGRSERRPVWIAPHLKGPADAPLLGGEKVYLVDDRHSDPDTLTSSPT